jgi:hypothetical protein
MDPLKFKNGLCALTCCDTIGSLSKKIFLTLNNNSLNPKKQ